MATATFIQDGASIDYTPGSAVAAGDVVVQGDLIGIAKEPIAANTLGALAVDGVFQFTKPVLSTSAMAAGSKAYWDASAGKATPVSSGNKYLGKVVLAATAAATTVKVKLCQQASA